MKKLHATLLLTAIFFNIQVFCQTTPCDKIAWENKLQGSANAMYTDSTGNSYVYWNGPGDSLTAYKLAPWGGTLWTTYHQNLKAKNIRLLDHSVLMSGTTTNTTDNKNDVRLLSLTTSGAVNWTYTEVTDDVEEIITQVDVAGDLIYITGQRALTDSTSEIFMYAVDTAGNKQWTQSYNSSGYDFNFPVSMKLADDGSFYLLGISQGDSTFYFLNGYDATGNLTWNRNYYKEDNNTYNPNNDLHEYRYAINTNASGNVWMLGIQSNPDTSASAMEELLYHLVQYDRTGNIQSTNDFSWMTVDSLNLGTPTPSELPHSIHCITPLTNNTVYAFFSPIIPFEASPYSAVIGFNLSNKLNYYKPIPATTLKSDARIAWNDSLIYLTAQYDYISISNPSSIIKSCLLTLETSTDSLHTFLGDNPSNPVSAFKKYNNHLIFLDVNPSTYDLGVLSVKKDLSPACTSTIDFNSYPLPVATSPQTDQWGNIYFIQKNKSVIMLGTVVGTEELSDERNGQLRAFPNPAKEYIRIEMNSNASSRAQYFITNVLGKIVIQGDVEAGTNQFTLNTGSLPAGVYLITVHTEESQETCRIVIAD
ncbi:MAG: T9SS type A sorting domain-containing protein [Flavobacteriales bacterium]|nr:T9SS type A sorting domain-containing protein [Flavobacteriales bacterium]